jgi:hypothetical protein
MKTAMQELKETVKAMIDNGGDTDLLAVLVHIDNSLKKEKEQIVDAVEYGAERFGDIAEQYYNQTYNQNK